MYQFSSTDTGVTLLGVDGTSGPDTLSTGYYGGTLQGGEGDDKLTGSYSDDYLHGNDGADTIAGAGGQDTILGGNGNDVFDITEGSRASLTLGAGADLIRVVGFEQFENEIPRVLDFTWNEDAIRFAYVVGGDYGEGAAASFDAAKSLAQRLGQSGYRVVSVQVGADVFVFGNWSGGIRFDSAVRLVNRTLDDIAGANVGLFSNHTITEPGGASAAPTPATNGSVVMAGNMDTLNVGVLQPKNVGEVSAGRIVLDGPGLDIILTGSNFSTDPTHTQLFGQVTGVALGAGPLQINANVAGKDLGALIGFIDGKDSAGLLAYVMSGSDVISGGAGDDLIRAGWGNDLIRGQGGSDTIYAGGGDDVIYATAPSVGGTATTYLRGDDGNDWIGGADGFDDINGNMGFDTLAGGAGNDWVVGGKDGDRLFGDAGDDIVYGNIGGDVCLGGEGNDTVRGGQDDDQVFGGAGADFLAGDKGSDTLVGGAGADIFHSFVGADTDRIEDFKFAEGDRVMVPTGTQWTLEQVGPDLIVSLVGGGRIVMANITQASLPSGWIFTA